jgi:type I restriction enzyme S subunit
VSEGLWEIPGSWIWAKAGEISEIVGGGTPAASDPTNFDDAGMPWITPADLSDYSGTYISRGRRSLSAKGLASSSARVLPTGAVLFSSRAPIGYCVIAANPISTNQGFKSLVLKSNVLPEYVRHYLLASVAYIEGMASGTTFKEISGSRMAEVLIPIPPLAEQRRIVARIEALFARIRQARADLLRITSLSERYRLTVLRAALRGELTADWRSRVGALEPAERLVARTPAPSQPRGGREATDEVIPGVAALSVNHPRTEPPPGWTWVPLLRLARQESGHTPSRSVAAYWNGDIPWIGIRDAGAHHGGVIQDTAQHVTQAGLDNSSARLLPAQTVCLSRTASVGYVVVMGRPMATSQDFVTWTCSSALLPDFLKYALLAEGDDIRRFGKGSTHTTIYFPEIRALHICLPPLAEQHEIVRLLDQALPATANATHDADRAFILLDQLERSILGLAFRGELVPQNPNDEPATVLLARAGQPAAKASHRRSTRGISATMAPVILDA